MVEEEKNKILELFNPEGKVILDVGCGDGRYSTILSETCKKYVGIDIDDKLISKNNINNKKDNVCFKTDNIVNYSSEEKYDVIILSLAFHEISIKDQGLALLNMLDLLNRDGKIIVLDPALKNDSFQGLYNIAYEYLKYFNHDYTVNHSKDVINKAVQDGLCKIVKKDYLEIPYEFNSIEEIYDMVDNDEEFKEVKWTDNKKETLHRMINKFFENSEKIILYDKLDITVIEIGDR